MHLTHAVSIQAITSRILFIRGLRVMLAADLAQLYAVETRNLVQAVKRNKERFPGDFFIILENQELTNLRSQFVISSSWGGSRYTPYAFTEQGIAMLSSVLRSPRAIQVNIEIMRAFVRLRQLIATNVELAKKVEALEQKYDGQFRMVFDAIRELMNPSPSSPKRKIGFRMDG